MPFWFWNDELSERELIRQIDDFVAHGVYGFVIHPRVGLPRSIGWMSDAMLGFMKIAIDAAREREMKVILYDEGMYPSGSSCGQVVAADPSLACRGFARIEEDDLDAKIAALPKGHHLVARVRASTGRDMAIIDRPADAYIRGLHYVGNGPDEDEPVAGDILNPRTTAKVIELIHEPFYAHFKEHFGSTIIGVFTDEPNPLGKCREKDVRAGTTGILEHVNRTLGYDFTPHLPALWHDDEPDAARYRRDYLRGIRRRMDETWYRPLSEWCVAHNVALCGHPADGDEIGTQRFFHIPGQDIVWRFIEPGKPSAVEGPESTTGKNASSAMIHLGRRRNSNEFCGAYGHETTYEEFKWQADWLLVRGCNLLIPHAFYYSVRGARRDERPPQVGPNGKWWGQFKAFADHSARLSALNTDSRHVCDVAILADPDHCPWHAAKACFERQIDFNYLDQTHLLDTAKISDDGISIAGMKYGVLIVDTVDPVPPEIAAELAPLAAAGRVIGYRSGGGMESVEVVDSHVSLAAAIDKWVGTDACISPASADLRVRHVIKDRHHAYILVNEGSGNVRATLTVAAKGKASWIDTVTGRSTPIEGVIRLDLRPFEVALLCILPE